MVRSNHDDETLGLEREAEGDLLGDDGSTAAFVHLQEGDAALRHGKGTIRQRFRDFEIDLAVGVVGRREAVFKRLPQVGARLLRKVDARNIPAHTIEPVSMSSRIHIGKRAMWAGRDSRFVEEFIESRSLDPHCVWYKSRPLLAQRREQRSEVVEYQARLFIVS